MSGTNTLHATIEMVHHAHGGELGFWRALVDDKVAPGVRESYRRVAEELALRGEDHWIKDMMSLEEGAKQDWQTFIEVWSCLGVHRGKYTNRFLAKSHQSSVSTRVREGILDLLETAQVALPPGREVLIGPKLADHLTGWGALVRFGRLLDWLADVRRLHEHHVATGTWIPARLSLFEQLAPGIFAQDDRGEYRRSPSFRLFLRNRLFRVCKKRRWPCRDSRGLRRAFVSISRERIGEIFDRAHQDVEDLKTTFETMPQQMLALDLLDCDLISTEQNI
jgi:hypothetical protein